MNGRNILSFTLLLIGAAGTWYLAQSLTDDDAPLHKTQMLQNGFYLKSARIFGTAATGELLYEIDGDVTEIRTSYLELEPEIFRARTDQRVQIRIGARSITATGMLAMLQTNQLKLNSNVSGKFVP